jgi:hypothetical protein
MSERLLVVTIRDLRDDSLVEARILLDDAKFGRKDRARIVADESKALVLSLYPKKGESNG